MLGENEMTLDLLDEELRLEDETLGQQEITRGLEDKTLSQHEMALDPLDEAIRLES